MGKTCHAEQHLRFQRTGAFMSQYYSWHNAGQLTTDVKGKYIFALRSGQMEVLGNDGRWLGAIIDDASKITAVEALDDDLVAVASDSGEVAIWSLETMRKIAITKENFGDRLVLILHHRQSQTIAAYSRNGRLTVYRLPTLERIGSISLGSERCRQIISSQLNGEINCIEMSGNVIAIRFTGANLSSSSKTMHPDGLRFFSTDSKSQVEVAITRKGCATYRTNALSNAWQDVEPNCQQALMALPSPDGQWLAVAKPQGLIEFTELDTQKRHAATFVMGSGAPAMTWSRDSRYLLINAEALPSQGYPAQIVRHDPRLSQSSNAFSGMVAHLIASDVATVGENMVLCASDGYIELWNTTEMRRVQRLFKLKSSCRHLAVHDNNNLIAAVDDTGELIVFDLNKSVTIAKTALNGKEWLSIDFLRTNHNKIQVIAAAPSGAIYAFDLSINTTTKLPIENFGRILTLPWGSIVSHGSNIAFKQTTAQEWALDGRLLNDFQFTAGANETLAFHRESLQMVFPNHFFPPSVYKYVNGNWLKRELDQRLRFHVGQLLTENILIAGNGNGVLSLHDLATGNSVAAQVQHSGPIRQVLPLSKTQRVLSTGDDGAIVLMSVDVKNLTIKELAKIFRWPENSQATIIPEGYFEIVGGIPLESFLIRTAPAASAVVNLHSLFDIFHRPDIVQAKLRGEDISKLIGDLTIEKALQNPPPSVTLSQPPAQTAAKRIKVAYTLTPDKGGVAEKRIFHNGKLIESDGTYKDAPGKAYAPVGSNSADAARYAQANITKRQTSASESAGPGANQPGSLRSQLVVRGAPEKRCTPGQPKDPCQGEIEVEVIPGEENTISVVAFNRDNTIQSQAASVSFQSTLPKDAPHLWLLSVGIDQFTGITPLKNARKDAQDFACTYAGKDAVAKLGLPCTEAGQAQSLFKPENIHVVDALFDSKATKGSIQAALAQIAQQAKPSDTFVWFVASHGMMDANSLFGIIAHDTRCTQKDAKNNCTDLEGHLTSNDILEASKKIKAMKQLMVLDTCHSGGLDSKMSGLYDARMSLLAKNMGLHMYASAQATETAQDGIPGTNGTFTAQLLAGIKGAAPKNSEGQISVMTLGQYAKQKTIEATQPKIGAKDANGQSPKDTKPAQTPVIQHFGLDAGLVGVGRIGGK